MDDSHDPNETVDVSSAAADSLDAGLAAGFGRRVEGPASILSALGSTLGSVRPVLLQEAQGESALVVKPGSDEMPSKEETGDRYQLSGEIARGGMGAVLRGRDVDLGRDLAVKVLLEKYVDRPEVARRFIEEAQIGGQLQHPGVVPVYDIGRFGDRPFFTMKLVKGQTLSALLGERTDAVADRPRLLGIVLQAAQAMAYAHAKGVIHRDLKPANIMVGAFGEVQVMDWGLAKVLAEGGVADEERASREHQVPEDVTKIRTVRSTGSAGSFGTDTESGSILGTPAYMPPEQACGDIAKLDRRADVFALGAMLCETLTGKPPYVGRSSEEVRRKAANADLAYAMARLDDCRAELELIALTKRCLSPEAIDRPKDAQGVVDALTAYLDGVQERLQTAERERAVALAREVEERKRRKVQLALAASVLAMMLGVGAFAWWQNEQVQLVHQRDARNGEAAVALLNQCEEALRSSDAAKADLALEAARTRAAEGGADKEAKRLGRLAADLALLRDLDTVDRFRWTPDENKLPDATAVATRTREALRRFGADPDAVSPDEAATRVSTSMVRERIVSALDRLLQEGKKTGVRALLARVDAEPYRDTVRDAIVAGDRAKVAELAGQQAALGQLPGFVAFLGQSGAIPVERRRQLLQAAVRRRSGNLDLLMTLGFTYPAHQEDGANERLRWFQAAVAAAPANSAALNNLGIVLRDKGQLDEAIACFKEVIELDPKFAGPLGNLGIALVEKGQLDEAIACFKEAIDLQPSVAIAHNNLGNALRNKGRVDEAIACFKRAIELGLKVGTAHSNLGNELRAKGQLDEAIDSFNKAIELDPKDALAHFNLGNALADKGQFGEAAARYKKAIALEPKRAEAHAGLGLMLHRKGQFDEAIACYEKAIALNPKYAYAHLSLGNARRAKGQLDEAIACYKKAIELDPRDATFHNNLGTALADKGEFDEAIAFLRKAIELNPKRAETRSNLARVERMAAGRDKLPAFQNGTYTPASNAERLALADFCQIKKLHNTAVGLYAAAFAADPKLADDLSAGHRYNAACYAALAEAGKGEDASKLDDKDRALLRRHALHWLKADLAAWGKLLASGPPQVRPAIMQTLSHWQTDTDLAGIRDAAALAKIPADEQKAFTQLWADVAALLRKAQTPATKESKP
ncbi:MAG: tetratricopeptide repeat protein [Isosphaeraceae bacterium]